MSTGYGNIFSVDTDVQEKKTNYLARTIVTLSQ